MWKIGVWKIGVWKIGVWKMQSGENEECGNEEFGISISILRVCHMIKKLNLRTRNGGSTSLSCGKHVRLNQFSS